MDRNLETYNPQTHEPLLYAAALEGVDVTPLEGSRRFIAFGEIKYGYGPGCILDIVETEYVAEPHVTWFPWTTPKQRISHFKWAMEELSKTKKVFLMVEKSEMKFFEHFVKKGLLRKVGYLEDLPVVEEIHMYQYKGAKDEQVS